MGARGADDEDRNGERARGARASALREEDNRMRILVAILSAALMLAFAACAGETEPTATPTSEPTAVPTVAAYPKTVTDVLGRSVEIPSEPTKILAVSPTAQELLYRIGGSAVGRVTSAKFPAETETMGANLCTGCRRESGRCGKDVRCCRRQFGLQL